MILLIIWGVLGLIVAGCLYTRNYLDDISFKTTIVVSFICGPICWCVCFVGILTGIVQVIITLLER